MALVPEVPGVGRRPRGQVDPLLDGVELLLIVPLRVVHLLRRTAAAVQRNPQAAAPRRLLAERLEGERHLQVAVLEHAVLDLLGPVLADQFDVRLPEQFARRGRIRLGQWHPGEIVFREFRERCRILGERCLKLLERRLPIYAASGTAASWTMMSTTNSAAAGPVLIVFSTSAAWIAYSFSGCRSKVRNVVRVGRFAA